MFGRRITGSGWLKLSALAFAVVFVVFIISAPLGRFTVRVDLPPATATPRPMTLWDGLMGLAWATGVLLVIGLLLVVVVTAIWLVIRTARKIIQAQPRANP